MPLYYYQILIAAALLVIIVDHVLLYRFKRRWRLMAQAHEDLRAKYTELASRNTVLAGKNAWLAEKHAVARIQAAKLEAKLPAHFKAPQKVAVGRVKT